MGFLDRFFKPKTIEKEVSLEEIKEYTEQLLNEKFIDIDENIDEISSNIAQAKKKIKENTESLKKAELQNDKMPMRVKHLMQGNREAYIKKINKFMDDIEIPKKYDEIKEFRENFNEKLEELSKTTVKGYEILKEFFYNQATDIAMGIKDIENNVNNLVKVIEENGIDKIEHLKKSIDKIEKHDYDKKRLNDSIKEYEYEIKELEQKIENVKIKFEEIKKSKEYDDYKKTKEDKENIINEIKSEKDKLLQEFSVLEKSLKKYKRDSLNEKLIEEYLEDPGEALMNDNELNIAGILEKLKGAIDESKLELKDKKKSKSLKIIKRLDKEFLSNTKLKLKELENSKKILNERLRKNNINNKYQEEKYRIEHYTDKLEQKKKRLEELKKEEANLDLEKVMNDIKKEYLELFNIKLNFQSSSS
jgi:hypothetical protein